MSTTTADLWTDVWAEYDARSRTAPSSARLNSRAPARLDSPAPARLVSPAPTRQVTQRRAKPRRRAWAGWLPALLALGLAAAYAAAPIVAAQQVTRALSGANTAALAESVDWSAMEASLGTRLLDTAQALPPGRTAGLSPAGLEFLQGMAREVTAGLATQTGLTDLVRRRLGLTEMPGAVLAPPRFQPDGLTSTRLLLASAHGEEAAVTLTLVLTDPLRLRWQVVGVELAEGADL
jgi:hypothetical protein